MSKRLLQKRQSGFKVAGEGQECHRSVYGHEWIETMNAERQKEQRK